MSAETAEKQDTVGVSIIFLFDLDTPQELIQDKLKAVEEFIYSDGKSTCELLPGREAPKYYEYEIIARVPRKRAQEHHSFDSKLNSPHEFGAAEVKSLDSSFL